MQAQHLLGLCFMLCVAAEAAQFVPRTAWTRWPTGRLPRLHTPSRYVIIHHTATAQCYRPQQCILALRVIQNIHRRAGLRDIGYHFLIGGDGRIYEGLGFGIRGEHAPTYNGKSLSIAFIGNYQDSVPSSRMLKAARRLISIALKRRQIQPNYVLLSHFTGRQLLAELSKWPRWQLKA